MLLRTAIKEINGLRFMIDNLDIQSGLAKRMLYEIPYMTDEKQIENELHKIEYFRTLFENNSHKEILSELQIKLSQIKDIRGTITRIKGKQVLGDVELFELKVFSLISKEIVSILEKAKIDFIHIPLLEDVILLLDPDRTNIPHFYIYDSYSKELADIRKQIKAIQKETLEEESKAEKLYFHSVELEDEIRKNLSEKIYPHTVNIAYTLDIIGHLDILIAKALQAVKMNLCKPEATTKVTHYKSIYNPLVKEALKADGKDFQAIDIEIEKCASLITGANMTGKSVILKTVALAQALFQFGFYIPAKEAKIASVDEISISAGDEQNELNGLSSFAAEMLNVNKIIKKTKSGRKLLVLIDELARTTNPTEGKAIVNATVDFLTAHNVRAFITTHYSGINSNCRKFRVKGFMKDKVSGNLNIHNINNYIDYSLIEDNSEVVPHEAILIASILGVDSDLLETAKKYLNE